MDELKYIFNNIKSEIQFIVPWILNMAPFTNRYRYFKNLVSIFIT